MKNFCLAVSVLILVTTTASAAKLSGWSSDFAASTNAAISAHRPLVLLWANTGCEHCEALEKDVQTPTFTTWRQNSNYLFCFVLGNKGYDPNGGTKIREFAATAGGTSTSKPPRYPYVCLYWPKADGSVSAYSFTTESATSLTASADHFFANYVPMPDYLGGDLAFTAEYAHARLEAEVGFTEYVDVPLVRDGAAASFAATNTLKAFLGGMEIQSVPVLWKQDERGKDVRIEVPGGVKAGDKIAVSLHDDAGNTRGTVNVHVVAPVENSAKNPCFIGERTAHTLNYGEWTMDLDVAMEKFKAESGSRLMAMAGGSLWCPDCIMTDTHVLDTAAFKSWAVENKVILVDIDVPNLPNTTNSACLLTRVVGRTSDGYVSGRGTLATNELQRYQSGAGYLTRHMVRDEAAAAVIERNKSLVGRNTLNGGWNDPDRTNQNRTGIPNFFALRRDKTLVGTFETFDAIGPSGFKEAYIKRFSELVALCDDDGGEFSNRSWQTTTEVFPGVGAAIEGTLSAIDRADTYKLAASTDLAAEQAITVSGSDGNAVVTVSLIASIGGTLKTLSTATGRLSDGVQVTGVISSSGDYYVTIVGDGDGTFTADSTEASTVAAYTLFGMRKAIENPFTNDWTSRATTTTLPLYAADGVSLKGTLALTLKKTGKISAKYSNGKSTIATFSGKWDGSIAADGTATANIVAKKGWTLSLVMSKAGVIVAEVGDGTTALTSCECGLAENYGDFSGLYTVAMPSCDASSTVGAAVMTLKMATSKMAKAKGRFQYMVYLPDGKKLSGSTNVTWLDANFGIVPVLKISGVNTFAATLKVRRRAGEAVSARAVLALDGTVALWSNTTDESGGSRSFDVFGSWYDKKASLLTGIENKTLTLQFTPDVSSVAKSQVYGSLESIVGGGALITVTDTKATTERLSGFTFRVNRSTGVVTGTMRLVFSGKPRVPAKYTGVLLRGWFSDCDCGEDTDPLIEIQNIAFAAGFSIFVDKVNRKTVKRSFPVEVR